MPIVGSQITSIAGTRGERSKEEIKINTNAELKNVSKRELKIGGKKQTVVNIDFIFSVTYGEKFGKIDISGSLLYDSDKKEIDEVIKGWKKNKKLPEETTVKVMNAIIELGLVQSVPISVSLQLPPPLRFPRVRVQE